MKRLLRVRRLVEYVGEPEAVLAQLARSMKEGVHDMPLGNPKYRITISQLGPAEFVNGDDAVTVALDEQAGSATDWLDKPVPSSLPEPPARNARLWGAFPSHEAIRNQRKWWRKRKDSTRSPHIVELIISDGEIIDDTGDSPPLVLRKANGEEAASFSWYLKDQWAPVLP